MGAIVRISMLKKESGKYMSTGQYDKDCGYNIFRRLPCAKQSEAYSSTGNLDAPWSEDVPS
jgi:hypothetical protein